MPEIPEVEAFKYYIDTHCLHQRIEEVQATDKALIHGCSWPTFAKTLQGNEFVRTQRLGKYLIIDLKKPAKQLIMHFGLTGSLAYTAPTIKVPGSKVTFTFARQVLHWISIRKFEKLWLVDNCQEIPGIAKLGKDPLDITKKAFLNLTTQEGRKNVKAFLMDQELIAGIGNEYADEILLQAGIDPHHKLQDLSTVIIIRLYQTMKKVLRVAIKIRVHDIQSATWDNFFTAADRHTFPTTYLQAHRHVDMQCPLNKNHTLKKTVIAGRPTYYCPLDQH